MGNVYGLDWQGFKMSTWTFFCYSFFPLFGVFGCCCWLRSTFLLCQTINHTMCMWLSSFFPLLLLLLLLSPSFAMQRFVDKATFVLVGLQIVSIFIFYFFSYPIVTVLVTWTSQRNFIYNKYSVFEMIHVTRFDIYDCYEFIFTIDVGEISVRRKPNAFGYIPLWLEDRYITFINGGITIQTRFNQAHVCKCEMKCDKFGGKFCKIDGWKWDRF